MARYIDVDKIQDRIKHLRDDVADCEGEYRAYNVCLQEINKDIFTADVEEVKHGKWLKKRNMYECSICSNTMFANGNAGYNYCFGCGAKMDGKKGE